MAILGLGSLLSGLGKFASTALPIAGGIAQTVSAFRGGGGSRAVTMAGPGMTPTLGRLGRLAGPAIGGGALLGAVGGMAFRGLSGGGCPPGKMAVNGRCRRMVCRINRCTGQQEWVPAPKRMNVTNVRALRRSLRRVEGFERVARRVLRITTGRQPAVRFKKRGRKR